MNTVKNKEENQKWPKSHHPGKCVGPQSGQILCDPVACSPPGSSVHGFSKQEYWSGLPLPTPGRDDAYETLQNLPATQKTRVQLLGREDPLE